MTQIHPGISRHAVFGDEADSNRLYIVPEADVLVTLTKESSGVKMVVKFKGHVVTLPRGSAVQYVQLQAITASGGIGFAEPDKPKDPAPVSHLHLPIKRN